MPPTAHAAPAAEVRAPRRRNSKASSAALTLRPRRTASRKGARATPSVSTDASDVSASVSPQLTPTSAAVATLEVPELHISGSSASSLPPAGSAHKRAAVVHRLHAPDFLHAPHVLTGYRVGHDAWDALRSTLKLHNQTLNIYTHFGGFLYFLLCLPNVLDRVHVAATVGAGHPAPEVPPPLPWTAAYWAPRWELSADVVFMTVFLVCGMVQMLTSALYHTFQCISAEAEDAFLRLDIVGIMMMIAGSFAVALHNGFTCSPGLQIFYMGVLFSFLGVAAVLTASKSLQNPKTVALRNATLVLAVAFGIVPTAHWVWQAGDQSHRILWALAGMFGSYGGGYVFFATKWPESALPGRFDVWLNSHQFWHLLVWLAGAVWMEGMASYAEWRAVEARCDAPPPLA